MELREIVARAISRRHGYGEFITSLPDADAALDALSEAGFVVVLKEPTGAMIVPLWCGCELTGITGWLSTKHLQPRSTKT